MGQSWQAAHRIAVACECHGRDRMRCIYFIHICEGAARDCCLGRGCFRKRVRVECQWSKFLWVQAKMQAVLWVHCLSLVLWKKDSRDKGDPEICLRMVGGEGSLQK